MDKYNKSESKTVIDITKEGVDMQVIIDFFKIILRVLLFPFRFIITFVEEIGKNICPKGKELFVRLLKIIMSFIEFFIIVPEHLIKRFKEYIHERNVKHKSQKYLTTLKNTLMSGNYTMYNKVFHYFILIATTGLQFISFYTTFAGTNYYFGNITKPEFLGPFIITSVIQFSVLFLSNGVVQKDRINSGKKGMLAFFLFVSIMFSYTGMIHTIVPPSKQMKTNYEDFISQYEEVYHIYQSNFNTDENVSSYVSSRYQQLDIALNNQISALKSKRDATPKNSNTSSSHQTTTNQQGQTTSTSSSSQTINVDWTKYNNQYTSLVKIDKDLSQAYISIKDQLISASQGDENTVIAALKNIKEQEQFISIYNFAIDTLKDTLESNDLELSKLSNFETIYYLTQSLDKMKASKCLTYEQIEDKVKKERQMTSSSQLESLALIANTIDEEIERFKKTPLYLAEDLSEYHIDTNQVIQLRKAADTAQKIEDFNVLAFGYLRSGHPHFSKAVITFIFAMFIDLTTLLMPLFMEKSRKNVLFVKNRKDIVYEEEDLLERLLESVYPLDNDFILNAQNIRNELNDFIGLFEVSSNEAMEDGFSLQCDAKILDEYLLRQKNMTGFIVFTLNCHYLYRDSEYIYSKEDKYYLRTKFVLWIHNATASLSQYIYDYQQFNAKRGGIHEE